jgi:ankyrin repeat protein
MNRGSSFEGWKLKVREEQQLREAARNNNQQLLKDFIDLGHDVNSQMTVAEVTALHEATEQGHREATTMLLGKGANPNLKECRGFTPLHMAVKNQDITLINLLVGHDAHALKDKQNKYPEGYTTEYYKGDTPIEGIDIKNEEFFRKAHPALLHARLATLAKERAYTI